MPEDSAITDAAIDLKKRARRRLVGAAALALLAVIVLPIVMDSEPKPSGQEIQIRIPGQDTGSLPNVPISSHVNPVAPKVELQPSTVPTEVTKSSSEKVAITQPQQPTGPTTATTQRPAPENNAKAEPVKSELVKKTEAARATAVLEGKEAEQWMVQLGAYQNAVNVKTLVAKLRDMGFTATTEKIDLTQGTRTRVRAGPFASKDAAEKARARIKKIGVDGSVVAKQ